MAEQREHVRVPIELRVEYRKLNSFFADYTRNISRGGTYIQTRKPLPVGTRFLFRLSVPARAEPFSLAGEVVRVELEGDDPGMGIRFVWPDEAARAEFDRMVERLMSESLGDRVASELIRAVR
jgi:type IV pilus assembly protein PilZ